MTIYDIIKEIENTSSTNDKIAKLTHYKNTPLLKEVIFKALDTFTQYYIRKIPSISTNTSQITLEHALSELDKLSTRQLTGHAAQRHLQYLLELLSEKDAYVLSLIIMKDLRCGLGIKTVNKVYPNLVSVYPCMLAETWNEKNKSYVTYPGYLQLKADGIRLNIVVKNQKVFYFSRSGKAYDFLGHHDEDILEFCKSHALDNIVFDGEGLCVNPENGDTLPREIGNGIISKANKGKISLAEVYKIRFVLWDIIDLNDFNNGIGTKTYTDRFNLLNCLNLPSFMTVIETHIVDSDLQVSELYAKYVSMGQEGAMYKNPNAVWENKRTVSILKLKESLECELKIIGYKEGTGKYLGMIGSLDCISADGVSVNISGFTDEFRKLDYSTLHNQIVSVIYNCIISDVNGNYSLFLPRFKELREDKSEPDTLLK